MAAKKDDHIILGVHLTQRVTSAVEVQRALTEYGCNIKTRIGLHEVSDDYCSPEGVVILEMYGDPAQAQELRNRLTTIEGVEVQTLTFAH